MTTKTIMSDEMVVWDAHCPECGRFCKVTRLVYAVRVFKWGEQEIREMDGFSHAEGKCKRCGNVKPTVQHMWRSELE